MRELPHPTKGYPYIGAIETLCFEARELLGGYMSGFEETNDCHDDEEAEEDEYVYHSTEPVPINDLFEATLTNSPLIKDNKGSLVSWLHPNYVGLYLEHIWVGHRSDQLIFELPDPDKPAYIYHGFSFNDKDKINPADDKTLQKIRNILGVVRKGLRYKFATDTKAQADSYLSQTPTLSVVSAAESILNFDNNQ